uniref:Uncharacterized protein n=1 Tax=uncultured bacterium fosmid pJB18D1_contig I TaxID=1478057 RepID=A0A0H3U7B6_9BACT|nr:hypothetical protein [uncultured bacterium fosmid pJB18D1_contig I]
MKNFLKIFLLTTVATFATETAPSKIPVEMEGMEAELRGDGTFLIGGPTYIYDRILGAGGLHSESELWTPGKLRDRLLFNRMSGILSWAPMDPAIWMKTGNELGDLIYQDFITAAEDRPMNHTPILEGGFRTPSFHGFWATARLFQDDHFSQRTMGSRKDVVEGSFDFFGENWPLFSSAYGGFGYTNSLVNASLMVGEEYYWLFTETSRWIPVHNKPRVEGRVDLFDASLTLTYEDAEYQNKIKKEHGSRKELNGSLYYRCGNACKQGIFLVSAGLAFRAVDDSGTVYTELEDDRVFWPFIELHAQPVKRLTADVMFGINDRDWMVQDSIQFVVPTPKEVGTLIGVKNISATRLNPMADTKEYYGKESIDLTADGQMSLMQTYMTFADTVTNFAIGGRASLWAEYGAETFDVERYGEDNGYTVRYGDVSRINDWIKGVTAELWFSAWYKKMFDFKASAGFERIDGDLQEAEVTPAEYYVGFSADWFIRESFKISHSIHYRSDAQWNLRSANPMEIKGDWYWDASFEQQFPKYGIYLTGTLLHVMADETIEAPNASYNSLRFICSAKKTF